MMRWIAGVIAVLALVVVLTSNQAQLAIRGVQSGIGDWFELATKVPDLSQLHILRENFMRNNLSLQPHQTDYVIEITSSVEDLQKFYTLYCVREDKNPFIFGANKIKLCQQINASGLVK